MGHTPGPWAVEDPMGFELSIVQANKPTYEWEFIASLTLPEDGEGFPREVVEANARLIALSPEMLDACVQAAQFILKEVPHGRPGRLSLFYLLEKLIAKAEGKKG